MNYSDPRGSLGPVAIPSPAVSHSKHLHHLVPKMIDDFNRNPSRRRLLERPRSVAVERFPSFPVNFGFQRRLERFVGVIRAEEVGVTHEKTLRVIVGIDKPAGDAVRAVAPNLARVGMKHINTVDENL